MALRSESHPIGCPAYLNSTLPTKANPGTPFPPSLGELDGEGGQWPLCLPPSCGRPALREDLCLSASPCPVSRSASAPPPPLPHPLRQPPPSSRRVLGKPVKKWLLLYLPVIRGLRGVAVPGLPSSTPPPRGQMGVGGFSSSSSSSSGLLSN